MGPYVIAFIVLVVSLAIFPLTFAGLAAYYGEQAGFKSPALPYIGVTLGVLASMGAAYSAGFV